MKLQLTTAELRQIIQDLMDQDREHGIHFPTENLLNLLSELKPGAKLEIENI